MRNLILTDTGPLYALADPTDQFHYRATTELDRAADFTVVVLYPVVCEAHTLVLRRLGARYAQKWVNELRAGSVLANPDSADYIAAMAQAGKFSGQGVTLVDAVLAVWPCKADVPIWSFDRHFATMRSILWKPA